MRYAVNIAIFDTIRCIVPSLVQTIPVVECCVLYCWDFAQFVVNNILKTLDNCVEPCWSLIGVSLCNKLIKGDAQVLKLLWQSDHARIVECYGSE